MGPAHFGNPLTIYRGLSGPPGPKPRKSLEKVSRGLRPGDPRESGKSLGKVFRDLFETFSRLSRLFRDLFQTLGGSRGRRPRETFFRLFRGFGPVSGPGDPCKWSTGSQCSFHKNGSVGNAYPKNLLRLNLRESRTFPRNCV